MHWRLPPGHTFSGKAASGGDLKVPANMELIILRDEGLKSLLGERKDPASLLAPNEFPYTAEMRRTAVLFVVVSRVYSVQKSS